MKFLTISLKELFKQAISEKLNNTEKNSSEKPWMEFYGKGKNLKEELDYSGRIIAGKDHSYKEDAI